MWGHLVMKRPPATPFNTHWDRSTPIERARRAPRRFSLTSLYLEIVPLPHPGALSSGRGRTRATPTAPLQGPPQRAKRGIQRALLHWAMHHPEREGERRCTRRRFRMVQRRALSSRPSPISARNPLTPPRAPVVLARLLSAAAAAATRRRRRHPSAPSVAAVAGPPLCPRHPARTRLGTTTLPLAALGSNLDVLSPPSTSPPSRCPSTVWLQHTLDCAKTFPTISVVGNFPLATPALSPALLTTPSPLRLPCPLPLKDFPFVCPSRCCLPTPTSSPCKAHGGHDLGGRPP